MPTKRSQNQGGTCRTTSLLYRLVNRVLRVLVESGVPADHPGASQQASWSCGSGAAGSGNRPHIRVEEGAEFPYPDVPFINSNVALMSSIQSIGLGLIGLHGRKTAGDAWHRQS